ncbi:MAG: Ig-like domain-containing protein [Planctomycetota bacterium]
MKYAAVVLGAIAVVAVSASLLRAQDEAEPVGLDLDAMPPVVIQTVPEAGDDNVDPNLKSIKITFSKKMQDGSWSWSTVSADSFPETTGKPKYLGDGKTCRLPVKLEPGTTYGIWANSNNFGNFKDADGRKAVPYLLTFRTADK